MAEWHLNDLRNALERRGWQVVSELPSRYGNISRSWELERGGTALRINFNIAGDVDFLPPDRTYGCGVNGQIDGLYFSRKGTKGSERAKTWKNELEKFVQDLNQVVDGHAPEEFAEMEEIDKT